MVEGLIINGYGWEKLLPPCSHFLGKGGIYGIGLGKISRESLGKGVFLCKRQWLPIPEMGGGGLSLSPDREVQVTGTEHIGTP